MRRHVGGPFTPPRRASSGSYPEPRAGARRAPTSSSDDAGAAVKASVGGGSSDLDEDGEERTPADASEDDDARASLRDVDIGAREEPGERVRVLDDERADANSETDAHEDCEDCEDHARGDRRDGDEDDEEEREEEECASDCGDSLADHSSADTSLNELDPDNLRVLQSYGLRPQMSYESSENDTGSDGNLLDDNLLDDDDNLLDDGHEATGSAPFTPLPPTWRAAISASLRLSRRLGESPEFSRVAAGRRSDDDDRYDRYDRHDRHDDDDDESSSEEDADEDDDERMNASTRAAADEMLRAADVTREVAALFAARVPRGVATSWEDARRGIDLDAVCAERFGGGESGRVDRAGPSTRAFEPPCDRSFGFFGFDGDWFESGSKAFGREGPEGTTSRSESDDATCIAEAAASSTAFCPRKPRARAARAFADVPFVADLLEKLPGVDPSDERIACVLAAVTVDGHNSEDERGKSGDGRRRRRGNRAVSAVSAVSGSFPRASAPASGRGLGAMARRELAGGGLPGRDRRRGGRGDERRDARVAGRT